MAPLQCSLHGRRKPQTRPRACVRSFLLIAAVPCALALGSCSTALPQPEAEASAGAPVHRHVAPRKLRALFAPQTPPNCEYKGADGDGLDANLFAQLKLDYERHCYQHAEALVRRRLRQLQVSGLCEPRPVRPVVHRERFLRAAPAL